MSTYKINDNGIERDMTADEIAAFDETLAQTAKDQSALDKAKADKAKAKQAVIDKLGLTADEVAALFA
jgi:FMN-dependent NADH-azoreductase